MATISGRITGRDRWHQVPASWGTYLRLLRDRGERGRPLYTYLDGRLTIVSPGIPHESLTERLRGLLELLFLGLEVPFRPMGSLTLKSEDPHGKGAEPDASYYLSNLDRVKSKTRLRMGIDPAPDLVIETVVSHPARDALRVHAAFGVKEVWVCQRDRLRFLVLSEAGRYTAASSSSVVPNLTPDDLAPWVFRSDLADELALRREFLAWVVDHLRPRLVPNPDPPNA